MNKNESEHICALCGNTIKVLSEAISEPDGSLSHFDCVIEKIRKEYRVEEPDTVSYIGQGRFAVCTRDSEGKYTIRDRINYESTDSFLSMKKLVESSRE